ncbi:MAG TPA: DUF397 domain-containing protein [Actinocatenispora sp.]
MSIPDIEHVSWFKSSRSGGQGGNCVEVATSGTAWYLRDSKDPDGGVLAVDPSAWSAFLATLRRTG